jgi:hypothetical protein
MPLQVGEVQQRNALLQTAYLTAVNQWLGA